MQLFKPTMNSINFFNYVTQPLLYMFLIIFGSMFTTCYTCHCSCTSTVVPDMVQMNLFGLVHTHSPLYVFLMHYPASPRAQCCLIRFAAQHHSSSAQYCFHSIHINPASVLLSSTPHSISLL